MIVASYFAFHETYPALILRRRDGKERQENGNSRYYTLAERLDAERTMVGIVGRSLSRPLRFLAFRPIIQIMVLLSALEYGILYIVLATFSDLWVTQYHQRVDISGLHYIAVAVGGIAVWQIGRSIVDKIFAQLKARYGGEMVPEYHLPLMNPTILFAPTELLIYCWAAQAGVHWMVVDLGVAIYRCDAHIAGQPTQAYVIDTYPEYTRSATAARQLLRSLAAFGYPFSAPAMYQALRYGWESTSVALIFPAFELPAPIPLRR